MTSSEYRYHIEKIHYECIGDPSFLLSDEQFQQFVLMAKSATSGNLVLENWKIYLGGGGNYEDFYEWWCEYRPDKLEIDKQEDIVRAGVIDGKDSGKEKKKSPFDAVKKRVRIE
jgi:hypothetical protein